MQRQRKESHVTWGQGKRSGGERNPARTTTVVISSPVVVA
jgi:hypothetical protein